MSSITFLDPVTMRFSCILDKELFDLCEELYDLFAGGYPVYLNEYLNVIGLHPMQYGWYRGIQADIKALRNTSFTKILVPFLLNGNSVYTLNPEIFKPVSKEIVKDL